MSDNIESKIFFAERESARKRQITALVAALVVLVTIIVAGLYFIVPLWPAITGSDSVAENTTGDEKTETVRKAEADHEANTKQRDAFKQQLNDFQTRVEPALSAKSVAIWATDDHSKILADKKSAVEAFGAGNYTLANELLQRAVESAEHLLQLAEENFHLYMKTAIQALESGDPPVAQASIAQVLLLKPNHVGAKALKARIDVLPEVLRLSDLASKARVENNLRGLKAHLQEIIRLDPIRKGLEIELQAVTQRLLEEDFTSHVAAGIEAVHRRDLHAAQRSLQQAQAIYPRREEVALLHRDVQQLGREILLQKHLRAARVASSSDDWESAQDAYRKALAIDDANAMASEGARLAAQILDLHKAIVHYRAHPHRLSSANVEAAAKAVLQKAESLYSKSPGLAVDAQALSALIADYSTPLEVVVRSDNKTDILVRGVGVVGKTLEKTVSLKPGTYIFEGKRSGYKSKLIQVEVSRDGVLPEIILVCDERV